jgi:hypothetical protein
MDAVKTIKKLLYLPLTEDKELTWELTKSSSLIELILMRRDDGTYDLIHKVNFSMVKTLYLSQPYIVCIRKINSMISTLKDSGFILKSIPEAYKN